jgi:hypothetical protein
MPMQQRIRQRPPREAQLRATVLRTLGETAPELREWNTRVCSDCYKDVERYPHCRIMGIAHLPPLYYALVCSDTPGDMPLGMGASAAEALQDLLWHLRADDLLGDLRAL